LPLLPPEYAVIVEQAPILIWRADLTMGCDYFNDRWLAFTGRSLSQELGHGWAEGVHPEDLARCLEIYTTSFAARRVFEMEYRLRHADGSYRWLFDRGVPFSAGGQFAGYIGSCIDVTARVEAERALAAAREAELAALRALLPICACCKKIRDEAGAWHEVDRHLAVSRRASFTHTYCPVCFDKLAPEA
jgi:PAS domain S-box-containing protein